MLAFLICGAVFLYPYLVFPVLIVVSSRFVGSADHPVRQDDTVLPKVSLLISAYNEERVIRQKIINSLSLDYPQSMLEIIVASDGSTDSTVEIVNSFASRGVRLSHSTLRRGKNPCLNEAINDVTGDIVVFTDANAMFDIHAVAALVKGFDSADVGCVIGKECRVSKEHSGTAKSDGAYWAFENLIKRAQNRLGVVLVGNGPIFAIRRSLFKPLESDVANDFQTPMQIGNDGWKVIFEEKALSYESSATDALDEYRRKVRIVSRGLAGFEKFGRDMSGWRLWVFISHKFIRWFALYLQITLFLLNVVLLTTHGWLVAATFGAQLALYALAILGWLNPWNVRRNKCVALAFYFCLVNTAAAVAILKHARGVRVATWEKAASVRP
ncbi:glycosyltransferase family 2 protein [Paraburkholderia fynbosensis]|nr:glycosyltransferase family 2 protein [Paraburkholderia fynbosensis]